MSCDSQTALWRKLRISRHDSHTLGQRTKLNETDKIEDQGQTLEETPKVSVCSVTSEQQDSLCSKKGTVLSGEICLGVTGLLQAYTIFDEYRCTEILFTRTVLGLGETGSLEESTDESEEESEEEPKLKYERLSNGVTEILQKDAASCMTVHDKFLALGTHYGKVYLLDVQGNITQKFDV
ncbi:hypothetical protein STEG23_008660, partial [Scotinomys teguina]